MIDALEPLSVTPVVTAPAATTARRAMRAIGGSLVFQHAFSFRSVSKKEPPLLDLPDALAQVILVEPGAGQPSLRRLLSNPRILHKSGNLDGGPPGVKVVRNG